MTYSPSVMYLQTLVQEFAEAIPPHAIRTLYTDYTKTTDKPVPLAKYVKQYLKPVIILKLLDSRESVHFQNLSAKDISFILGKGVTITAVMTITTMTIRMLKRREYKDNFDAIRDTLYMQTLYHTN